MSNPLSIRKLRGITRVLALVVCWIWTTNCDDLPTVPSKPTSPALKHPVAPVAGTQIGNATDVGNLGVPASSAPILNENGELAGTLNINGNVPTIARWTPSTGLEDMDLHADGCTASTIGGFADNGQLVGTSSGCTDQGTFAFRWTPGSGIIALPAPDGFPANSASAYAYNNHGTTAGVAVDANGKSYPVRWDGITRPTVAEYPPPVSYTHLTL